MNFLLALLATAGCSTATYGPYAQLHADRFTFAGYTLATWPAAPLANATSVSARYVLDPARGAFGYPPTFAPVSWTRSVRHALDERCALADGQEDWAVWLLCPTEFFYCSDPANTSCESSGIFPDLQPSSAPATNLGVKEVYMGTASGLAVIQRNGTGIEVGFLPAETFRNEPIISVAVSSQSSLAVGTTQNVWRSNVFGNKWHFFRTPGIIDAPPTGLAFVPGTDDLWITNTVCVNVQNGTDFTFSRVGGEEGLPVGNLTGISVVQGSDLWLSSAFGAVRLERATGKYRYYSGPRYIADNGSSTVRLVHATPTGAIAICSHGISLFTVKTNATLDDKAAVMEQIQKRHRLTCPEPHPDIGWLSGDCTLRGFGNTSECTPQPNDNNGLWTAVYLVGEVLNYQKTKDPKAKANAWRYFQGIQFLNNVTGIRGLMARSVVYGPTEVGGPWHNSTAYPGWIWKGDTSADEVTGHMAACQAVYYMLAETPQEKQAALQIMEDIVVYIITRNYQLIDITGKPTTWGRWNPAMVNDYPLWYDNRGLFSLEILTWITVVETLTGRSFYADSYSYLTKAHQYDVNTINAKITQPSDDNYSDDELTFMQYMMIGFAMKFGGASSEVLSAFAPFVHTSIQRTWGIIANYRATPWAAIVKLVTGELSPAEGAAAVQTLQEWPLEAIYWEMGNTHRRDIQLSRDPGRSNNAVYLPPVLPYDEILLLHWNTNPYDAATHGDSTTESDTGAFKLALHLARFVGL